MKIITRILAVCAGLLCGSAATAQTSYKSLNYLYSISGTKTASGMHNREPNSAPATWTNRLNSVTGNFPALWSSDFLFEQSEISNRWTMTNEAKAQWANGALINLMFHACPPTQAEPCQWEGGVKNYQLSNTQWQELITDGSQLNRNWKARLDAIVPYLQDLKNNGVEVLFRPLHEMNQGVFWWAGRPGSQGTARLYQITHDYLKNTKGLTNLIWVWDVQDFGSLASDLANYNPGSNYWDVLALDMYYSDGQGYTSAKYNAMLNAAGGKPIAIGECNNLPSPSLLASQPRWAFFMGWSEEVFTNTSTANIQNTFWAGNVIVREEMPGWNNTAPTAPNIAYQRPVSVTSSYNSTNTGAKAVDADGNTRWESAYTNNQSIFVDLGATYNVNRVRLAWEAAYARDYQVQVSTNGTTWTTIKDVWGKTSATADNHTGLNANARYVKVYCINRATTYGFSLYEFEVYGTATGARTALASNGTKTTLEGEATVFPNPASSKITVQLVQYGKAGTQLTLSNGQGKTLLSESVQGTERTLDLATYPAGLYLLTLSNESGRVTRKITKE
ncbi:glycosyl hydrolase [Hymenobacter negativus]|uniref:Discoidin domain-containing protein n=1 Tax=Hymenobacter negativus TaxID=2795026 RepID=A0ABS3QIV1_9BACT|nr:glycosyl hydrolase [Hymenobacter negativus]MBO2011174.1 discoidin domain-containing protein [Hymenobacter negativus]